MPFINSETEILMNTDIADNLERINSKIESICRSCNRSPSEVMLVAIGKMKPAEDIQMALEAGQVEFGENKVQELTRKMEELPDERISWHMVGQLQTNKIKYMVDRVNWIQSVARKKALDEIEKRAAAVERQINVLIQVNISGEDQKSGCPPEELSALLESASNLKYVKVRGLMGIATLTEDREQIRSEFALLRKLRDEFKDNYEDPITLEHLSMGMTHDMDIAIEEGATMVRVGTAIFGKRDYQ